MKPLNRWTAAPHLRHLLATALFTGAFGCTHAASTFTVQALENSTVSWYPPATLVDTDLDFALGEALSVTASGTWAGGPDCSHGPDGGFCYGSPPSNTDIAGLTYHSLVGRFGADGGYFQIGSSYNATAPVAGRLYLGFADIDTDGNAGFVTATITGGTLVTAVPEPETYALMVAGLGVIGGAVARRRRTASASD